MFRSIRYDLPLHFVLLVTNWLPDNVVFLRLRGFLASFFFKRCGKNLRLGRNISFYQPSKITIGDNVYIAYGNWFSAGGKLEIGDEVIFGPKSNISTSNHTRLNNSFRYGPPVLDSIKIGKGVWIAGNCTITAGTDIGAGALIAANSVAKGSIEANCLYAGAPAKKIKILDEN